MSVKNMSVKNPSVKNPSVKICFLDAYTLNPGDLSWTIIKEIGTVITYDFTPPEKIIERARGAQVLAVNKTPITDEILEQLAQLQLIVVTATGYNNIDLAAAKKRNIRVCNAVGYSTPAVAQHVFALLLNVLNQVENHHQSVQKGQWASQRDFSYTLLAIEELAGKKLGIYGFGKIGQQVAKIGRAFGMTILAKHKHPERDKQSGVEFVSFEELLKRSDVVSLHAPLSADNQQIINAKYLAMMRPSSILINTGRGGLINEEDLRDALQNKLIRAAAVDVLSTEPPSENNPLIGLQNCIITPHIAWASVGARQRCLEETAKNIKAFLAGEARNVVV